MDPNPNLMEAARTGNINGLYEAIENKPNVLKEIEEIQFVNTPLHEAASAGQTNFALEMMNLAPSFGRKLNPDGLSPLDLALLNNHYDTVKRLVSFDGELVRVKGKERLTPLHRAAESDDKIGCLVAFLLASPPSIEDLTIRDETALHIAMKKSSAEAFKILYEWVTRAGDTKQLLQKKDAEGNSAETYHKQQQPKIEKSLQGVKAEKPSSLTNAEHATRNMYNYLRTPERFYERQVRKVLVSMLWSPRDLTMEVRNVVLVVAVLIATASFQAILDPPENDDSYSSSVLKRAHDTNYFFLLNTIAFTASVGVIIIVLQLRAYTSILHLSLIFLEACYWSTLYQVLSPALAITYYMGSAVYLFLVYYFKILFWTIKSHKPKLLALLLFSPCLEQKFLCLHQMGAL